MTHLSIGAWIDGAKPTDDGIDDWAAEIAGAGINSASIFLNPTGAEPHHVSTWEPERLALATEALHALDVEVWWTFWPVAIGEAVDEMVVTLESLLAYAQPDGIEFDAEGKYDAIGWGPGGEALAYHLGDSLSHLQALPGSLAVTAIPHGGGIRPQDRALIEVLSGIRPVEGRPQAYSQYQKDKAWTHGSLFRPGITQTHALEQWMALMDEGLIMDLRCGLMAGNQRHPAPHPSGVDALHVALDTVRRSGLGGVYYWSWKAIKDRRDVLTFLRRAAGRPSPDV